MWVLLWSVLSLFLFLPSLGCSSSGSTSSADAPVLSYRIESVLTGSPTNALIIEADPNQPLVFSISGVGFTADVELGAWQALKDRVVLSYSLEGVYSLLFQVNFQDGTPFIKEKLKWEYNQEIPAKPIVSFSEDATGDIYVSLIFAASLGTKTTEFWVEGDLSSDEKTNKKWTRIPSSFTAPIRLSSEDGIKKLSVKFRNIYQNESAEVELSILKKSTKPQSCSAKFSSSKTYTGKTRLRISAEDDPGVSLFYRVTGDVLIPDQKGTKFPNALIKEISLSRGDGLKNVSVQIYDEAGNACDTIPITITVDSTDLSTGDSVFIENRPYYTDEGLVNVIVNFSTFDEESLEMSITGGVETGVFVGQWVPYQRAIQLQLSPPSGNRYIFVDIRDGGNHELLVEKLTTHTHLAPYVAINSSQTQVTVSRFAESLTYTITGCSEIYDKTTYLDTYPCTPTGSSVSASFNFSNGTSLVKNVSF